MCKGGASYYFREKEGASKESSTPTTWQYISWSPPLWATGEEERRISSSLEGEKAEREQGGVTGYGDAR